MSTWQAVPFTPFPDFIRRWEGKDQGTVFVNILPGPHRRNRKMHAGVVVAYRLAVRDRNGNRFLFGAVPRVEVSFSPGESCYPKRAPDTRRPPSLVLSLHPIEGRSGGERMDNPRRRNVRMKDNAADIGQRAKAFLYLTECHTHACRQFIVGWTSSSGEESVN